MKTADKKPAYLSLGSNISPRRRYISQSLHLLEKRFPQQFRASSLYITEPFQQLPQQAYINAAVFFVTDLKPLDMLASITEIETSVGRRRTGEKWESRIIDIDILLWGNDIIQRPRLTIPHYDLNNRDFFLIPLLELNRSLVDPVSGMMLAEILDRLPVHLRTHPEKVASAD